MAFEVKAFFVPHQSTGWNETSVLKNYTLEVSSTLSLIQSGIFIFNFKKICHVHNLPNCSSCLNNNKIKQEKYFLGERHGLVVSTEDCQSKGRGIESRSFLLSFIIHSSFKEFIHFVYLFRNALSWLKSNLLALLQKCPAPVPKCVMSFMNAPFRAFVLCISTSKWVLSILFAGQNQFFDANTTFCVLLSHKM